MQRRSTSALSPARWSEDDFFIYLRHGESPPHGVALGPMRAVVRSLARLPDDDLRAIATYFASLNSPLGAPLEPALARGLDADAARDGPASRRREDSISSTVRAATAHPAARHPSRARRSA